MTHPEDETTDQPAYEDPGESGSGDPHQPGSEETSPQPVAVVEAVPPVEPTTEAGPPPAAYEPEPPPAAYEPEPPPPARPMPTDREASEETEPWQAPATPAPPPPVAPPAAAWQRPAAQQPYQQPGGQPTYPQQPPPPYQQPPPPYQQPYGQQQQPYPPPYAAQPPQYGYGQPPYPPQTYPQQQAYAGAYGAQQRQGRPEYGTSALVAFAGMLLVVLGVAVAVLGAWALTQGPEIGRFIRDNDIAVFGRQIERETLRSVLSPMPGVLMVLGLLQFMTGAGIMAHKGWARALGILFSMLGLLIGVFAVSTALALAPGLSVAMLIAIVLLVSYAFILLALFAGGSHFHRRYPAPR